MNISTKYFGNIEVAEDDKIIFPKGLFGFEENKSYFVLTFQESDDTLFCLQSADEPYLAFIVLNPYSITMDYDPLLTQEDLSDINARTDSLLDFYTIAVIHDNFQDTTLNLKCPIVVNLETKLAKQVMLENSAYSLRYPIKTAEKGE